MIDLKELEKIIDKKLSEETKETLLKFLKKHRINNKLMKCGNCDKMVRPVTSGEICPNCFCDL